MKMKDEHQECNLRAADRFAFYWITELISLIWVFCKQVLNFSTEPFQKKSQVLLKKMKVKKPEIYWRYIYFPQKSLRGNLGFLDLEYNWAAEQNEEKQNASTTSPPPHLPKQSNCNLSTAPDETLLCVWNNILHSPKHAFCSYSEALRCTQYFANKFFMSQWPSTSAPQDTEETM